MSRPVDLRLATEAIHEALAAQRKQVTRIIAEDRALIAGSRRAIDNSRELLGETEHPVRGVAARLEKLTLDPPRVPLDVTLLGQRRMDKEAIRQHLVVAQQHVELGERHIKRQREIVEELDSDQRSARSLLTTFEEMQVTHVADRDRLQDLLDAS